MLEGCLKVSLLLEKADKKSRVAKVWCAFTEVRGRVERGVILKSKLAIV